MLQVLGFNLCCVLIVFILDQQSSSCPFYLDPDNYFLKYSPLHFLHEENKLDSELYCKRSCDGTSAQNVPLT